MDDANAPNPVPNPTPNPAPDPVSDTLPQNNNNGGDDGSDDNNNGDVQEAVEEVAESIYWKYVPLSKKKDIPADVKVVAESFAKKTLNRLCADRLAFEPITVRPVPKRLVVGTWLEFPALTARNFVAGVQGWFWWIYGGRVTYKDPRVLSLPAPISKLESITFGGIEQDLKNFYVRNGNEVYMTNGKGFPEHQDLHKNLGEQNTWSVKYYRGVIVDDLALVAIGKLAVEIAGYIEGKQTRLPELTSNVTRDGMRIEIPAGAFPDGLTGIREVDMYVGIVNPYRQKRPTVIVSQHTQEAVFPTNVVT